MASTKPREITAENYRDEARRLIDGIQQLQQDEGHWLAQRGLLSEGVGTLYWQFGDPETRQWFERALDFYRRGHAHPNVKAALLLWKMSDATRFQGECEATAAYEDARLAEVAVGRLDLPEHMCLGALQNSSYAKYLLGRYEDARQSAERLVAEMQEQRKKKPYLNVPGPNPVSTLVSGLLEKDESRFLEGLAAFRKESPRWPTDGCSIPQDFYRYNLVLGLTYFPEAVRHFEPFGNGKGRGAPIQSMH